CNDGTVDVTYGINPSTGGAYIWVTSNHALRFATNSTERMRITGGGNVLIGKTADAGYKLDVNGTARVTSLRIGDGTITWDAANGALKFDKSIYSVGDVVADGSSSGFGGTGTGASNLFELLDVALTTPRGVGDILVWDGAKWVNKPQSSIQPNLTGYATQIWVNSQGFLTSHQSLANYVTLDTAQEIKGAKTFGIGKWRIKSTESNEIKDVSYSNNTIAQGHSESLNAITRGIDFRWYSTHWVIGNIRNGSTGTLGFGIGLLNSDNKLDLGLRVTKNKVYSAGYATFNGTSSQFLKADGSVDSTAYLPLAGGTMSGNIVMGTSHYLYGVNETLGS
ncbi:MAG: hypothetical protein K2H86_09560, partial [Muribaculaceae bacterium]|nr:hypothetical protein [Muribaculaceae bacterium]